MTIFSSSKKVVSSNIHTFGLYTLLIWGAEVAVPSLSAYAGYAIAGVITGAVLCGGNKIIQTLNAKDDRYSPADDYAEYCMRFDAECEEEEKKKYNTNPFSPDRPLPRDPRTKEPIPETNAPHTELGTKKGTKGKYPQAREFDAQGKPVKDIDFTDHGRPQNHPNPHEHKWKPNPTGGTPQRSSEAEPLTK